MTTILFEEGFTFKGLKFAWKGGKLYRLPCKKAGRHYGFRKLPVITLTSKTNTKGYRVAREKKSFEQLRMITKDIHVEIPICKQCRQN